VPAQQGLAGNPTGAKSVQEMNEFRCKHGRSMSDAGASANRGMSRMTSAAAAGQRA
jgi:hypothetical protein